MVTEKTSTSIDDRSVVWKVGIIVLFSPLFIFLPHDSILKDVIFPLFVGMGLLYISINKMRRFNLVTKWKITDGELLNKKVAIDNPYAREFVRSYFPYIKYSYPVHGKTYISDSVAHYRELKSSEQEIEKLMDKMTASGLKVYFNPNRPEESVLIANIPLHRKLFWLFIFFLGCTALSVGLLPLWQ
ncbi:MAG: DUF3592 domain-containing protein [Bacteroidales bacterium]|nr:DUF3592 domain-containing protein [Bacteroidales bacterium]